MLPENAPNTAVKETRVTFQADAESSERSARGRDRCRCGWNVAPSSDADHTRRDEPGTISSLGGSLPAARTCANTPARRQTAGPRADNREQHVTRCSPMVSLSGHTMVVGTWASMKIGHSQESRESHTYICGMYE